jgi:hypothetical protein
MGDNACTGEQMFAYDIDISWWPDRPMDVSLVLFEIPVRESAWRFVGPTVVCISEQVGYSSEVSEPKSDSWRASRSVGYNVFEYESSSFRAREFLPEYNNQIQPIRAHVFYTNDTDSIYETDPVPL